MKLLTYFITLILSFASICLHANEPNILLICVDDLRAELGCYGSPIVQSPHIDSLAADGLRFNKSYVQQAACLPSRTSMLTGLRPETTGISRTVRSDIEVQQLIADTITLPQHLKQNGYQTLTVGKVFHHFYRASFEEFPQDDLNAWTDQRFAGTAIYPNPATRQEINTRKAAAIANGLTGRALRRESKGPAIDIWDGGDPDTQYSDGAIATEAISLLNQYKGDRFFLSVGFHKPHLPWTVPQEFWDLYEGVTIPLPNRTEPLNRSGYDLIESWFDFRNNWDIPAYGDINDAQTLDLIRAYYACTTHVDAQIGRVLAEVDRLNLRDNTIIILWSDHGWKLGEYGDWNKHSGTEYDLQVPFIVSGPNVASNQTTDAIVEAVDIYPTIAELCGLSVPEHVEGSSFAHVLTNPEAQHKTAALSVTETGNNAFGLILRTEQYLYSKWITHDSSTYLGEDLFDHENSRFATENLAAKPEFSKLIDELSTRRDTGWRGEIPKTDSRAPLTLSEEINEPDAISAEENFENFPLGSLDSSLGWFSEGPASISSPGKDSPNALELEISEGKDQSTYTRYINAQGSTQIWVRFDAILPSSPLPLLSPQDATIALTVAPDSYLSAYSSSDDTWLKSSTTIQPNDWNNYELFVDFEKGEWSLRVNSSPVFSSLATNISQAAFLNQISVFIESDSLRNSPLKVDNLKLYSRPNNNVNTTFDSYITNYFPSALSPLASPIADPDGDRINNAFEYVFQKNPIQSNRNEPLPFTWALNEMDSTPFQITYRIREDDSAFTLVPQISSDLINWNDGPAYVATTSLESHGDGTHSIRGHSLSDFNTTDQEFMRLQLLWD